MNLVKALLHFEGAAVFTATLWALLCRVRPSLAAFRFAHSVSGSWRDWIRSGYQSRRRGVQPHAHVRTGRIPCAFGCRGLRARFFSVSGSFPAHTSGWTGCWATASSSRQGSRTPISSGWRPRPCNATASETALRRRIRPRLGDRSQRTVGRPVLSGSGSRVSANAISTNDLCKAYGPISAVDGVSLDVPRGEVFALLGPNGAGKTTFIEILEGYRRRTSGTASVLGVDPASGDSAWRARVGIVLQTSGLFEKLTVEELISHFAGFYPDPEPVAKVMDLVGITEKRAARCETLSGGQRRRVDVALGIIGNPELIFLDEPTTGFDPAARRQAWEVVRGLSALGKTVVLTTHYLDEAEVLADRVGIIVRGRIVELGAPYEIGGDRRRMTTVAFRREGALRGVPAPRLSATIAQGSEVVRITTGSPTAAISELAVWAAALGVEELPGLTVTSPTLEEIYLDMIEQHDSQLPGDQG